MIQPTIQDTARQMLLELGIPAKLVGYRFLCYALHSYAQNSEQKLTKELYPAIAKHFGYPGSRGVECSIRCAISHGWKGGPREVWNRYFPYHEKQPTNSDFIATMAQYLK